jgi:hypothetical protein
LALQVRWADADVGVVRTPITMSPRPEAERPMKRVLVRVAAPAGGCWVATIPNEVPRTGCGPRTFPLEVEGFVLMHFARQMPGTWHFSVAIEADRRVVQTVGPTTSEYPLLDIAYHVPGETP